ncbi:uncharacterized protein LOC134814727 [Bolinopsis microptera]|uniref:uncharacterized protein LOC134814727 n=1 Tax=Bolinopsis microptera TaxID=2820187 RepID=UPI00307AB01A
MGWRTLKAGFLVVTDAEESEKVQSGKLVVQWVSLLYDFNTKMMKLEVRECRTLQLPQMSLVLKANLVNITFASHDPNFLVCVESKRVGNLTLSFSTDTFLSEVLEWQTLFKSAISPNVTYAVTMIQDKTELPAILCVSERSVELSVAERTTPHTIMEKKGSSGISSGDTLLTTHSTVISTNVDLIKLTVEDTLMLTLNQQTVILRTNRLVELYQHLMSYFTDRDYVNTRTHSRSKVLEEDEANLHIPYSTHSTSPRNTSPSSRRETPHPISSPSIQHTHTTTIPSPNLPSFDSAPLSLTKLPKLAPLAKILRGPLSKPEPPPKPKNAKEILSQFEFGSTSSSHNSGEPIYKSVRKPKSTISASSIGIRGLSESSEKPEDIPALPSTPPEYANHIPALPGTPPEYAYHLLKEATSPRLSGISTDVDYVNTRITKHKYKSDLRSPVAEEDMYSYTPDDNDMYSYTPEDNDTYESLYSLRSYPLAKLPPPTETWLYQPTSTLDINKQQRVQSKMLFNKIQLFDKNILRKVNSKT